MLADFAMQLHLPNLGSNPTHFEINGHLSIGFLIVHSLGQGGVFHCFSRVQYQ